MFNAQQQRPTTVGIVCVSRGPPSLIDTFIRYKYMVIVFHIETKSIVRWIPAGLHSPKFAGIIDSRRDGHSCDFSQISKQTFAFATPGANIKTASIGAIYRQRNLAVLADQQSPQIG